MDMTDPDQKGPTGGPEPCDQKTDVQTNIISKYRDALKSGDKNLAKSYLLSARTLLAEDPGIANEIYVVAKADGDISEAAKCFANIFENIFLCEKATESLANEALVVANQMKEETRQLLNELKSQHLNLRSTPIVSSSGHARQIPSVSQSPLLSPRLRMSSEDRSTSRDSALKLDKHLNSSNKSLFYQQLFDHFDQDVRRNILNHSIDNCDNPFERCRLMMLSITLFNDSIATHGSRLLKTLIELSQSTNDKSNNDCDKTLGTSRPQSLCQYAKSMLVLDAIPIIFSLDESQNFDFNLFELFQHTIEYYSHFCLEKAAEEYELEELHEGLRRTIAARALAKDASCSTVHEENIKEMLNLSLNLLFDRFLHDFSNDASTSEIMKKLRGMIAERGERKFLPFDQVMQLVAELELENDIQENILFAFSKDDGSSSSQITAANPPPKGRGRPKKVQPSVIVSPDDVLRRHLQRKAKEAFFIFTSILQHMFLNSFIYLKQTRSRILLNFENPLANLIEAEISKSSNSRSSRAKNIAAENNSTVPSKKIKLEVQDVNEVIKPTNTNPINEMDEIYDKGGGLLNSEHINKVDREIVDTLREVHKCLKFLKKSSVTFDRLFTRLLSSNNSINLKWFLRIYADCMMLSKDFDSVLVSLSNTKTLRNDFKIKKEQDPSDLSTLTVSTGTSPFDDVFLLRALTQELCCHIQSLKKNKALEVMSDLLKEIRQLGLLNNDENYSSGNVIDEYKVELAGGNEGSVGFLFFDALSIIRYVVSVSIDILMRYMATSDPNKDALVGHVIVLSQVDWPNHLQIYDKCISWIRANKPRSTTPQCLSALTKFTYPEFFNYITDPNILEDFMALLNEGVTLDIKSTRQGSTTSLPGGTTSLATISGTGSSRSSGSSTRSGKAITTRGVNKTFKEDLKVALVIQMKNSSPMVPLDLVTEFVRTSLIPFLTKC